MINLLFGDCLKEMSVIKENTIDMVCCDLPYGTTKCSWDSMINLDLLWSHYNRIVKENGAIVLFAQTPFDKVLGMSNLKMLRYEWIWEKTHSTGFFNAKKMPMKAHENILVFYKKLPTYNPQKTTGHEKKQARRDAHNSEVYGKAIKKVWYNSTERYPRSVQIMASDKQQHSYHPTQKPVQLIEYLIKTYTNEGDHVLDNTMGSGTTGVASSNLNRQFTGIEINKKYFLIAKDRILSNYQTTMVI